MARRTDTHDPDSRERVTSPRGKIECSFDPLGLPKARRSKQARWCKPSRRRPRCTPALSRQRHSRRGAVLLTARSR